MKIKTFEGKIINITSLTLEVDRDRNKETIYKIVGTFYDKYINRTVIDISYDRKSTLNKYFKMLNELIDEQVQ